MSFVIFRTALGNSKLSLANLLPQKLFTYGGLTFLREVYSRPEIRRPTMGMALKEEAPAYITVRRSNGEYIMLNNMLSRTDRLSDMTPARSTPGKEQHYTDFTLLQIQEAREEKFSPQETFGEDFAFFAGEQSSFLSCAGVLVNTADFQWRSLWWSNYDQYLRGTKCVENRARIYLSWNDVLVEGYIIRASSTDQAMEPNQVPFNFTIYVTDCISLGDLNLAALAQYKQITATARSAEILGTREADVKINSQFVEIGPGFLERQLEAIFGTQNPEEALLIMAQNPGKAGDNIAAYLQQQAAGMRNGDTARDALASPGQVFGSMAPLLNLISGWSPGEEELAGLNKTSLSGRSYAKKIFGDNYKSTQSISAY